MKKALVSILSFASLSCIPFAAASERPGPSGDRSLAVTIKVDVTNPRSRQAAMSTILYGIEEWNRNARFTGKTSGQAGLK